MGGRLQGAGRDNKIVTAGHHTLEGIGTGTTNGSVTDQDGNEHHMELSGTNLPRFGQHMLSVSAATSMGIVAVLDTAKPRLDRNGDNPASTARRRHQLYLFSLWLYNEDKYRSLRTETFDPLAPPHRRMGHINSRSLDILSKVNRNGLNCNGDGTACDACAIGKNAQQAYRNRATYIAGAPFQLVFNDLMGPIIPEALDGYSYASKCTGAVTMRKEV